MNNGGRRKTQADAGGRREISLAVLTFSRVSRGRIAGRRNGETRPVATDPGRGSPWPVRLACLPGLQLSLRTLMGVQPGSVSQSGFDSGLQPIEPVLQPGQALAEGRVPPLV